VTAVLRVAPMDRPSRVVIADSRTSRGGSPARVGDSAGTERMAVREGAPWRDQTGPALLGRRERCDPGHMQRRDGCPWGQGARRSRR
jgi:hypothetical protein